VEGIQFVLLPKIEYERLCLVAGEQLSTDEGLPPLPKPDKSGRIPALGYARASLARDLIRDRKRAGLSQQKLAELAGVRQETISRIETGKHTASPKTVDRIMNIIESRKKRKGK
jgi:DNA-binding XRE family transcriptional regulator